MRALERGPKPTDSMTPEGQVFVWTRRSVLVTGAGGFIGSHLVERLLELGASVRAFVRYNSMGRTGWLEDLPMEGDTTIIFGDIADRESIRRAMDGVDTVFHLAALIGIPYSYHAPASYVQTNIVGTLNVLQAALETGVRRVVHTSTSEVYGSARYVPIDEEHPLQGQSPYAASKIAADKMAEAFWRSFGVPVVTVRPFNTYGPRQSARAVIPTIITQVLAGAEVKLGNLAPRRDFTYVEDTVDGFIRAAECPEVEGQVINLGTGFDIGIQELAELIGQIAGARIRIIEEDTRKRPPLSEVDRLQADNRKAQILLGWHPKWSLRTGLASTMEWFNARLHHYMVGRYAV